MIISFKLLIQPFADSKTFLHPREKIIRHPTRIRWPGWADLKQYFSSRVLTVHHVLNGLLITGQRKPSLSSIETLYVAVNSGLTEKTPSIFAIFQNFIFKTSLNFHR